MKKVRKYLTKKEYLLFVISMMIIMLSTFSYAFYYSIDNREEDIVTTGCFKVSFEDQNDINLDKAYPLSDSEGAALTPYTFTITNVCNAIAEYQVNIETLNDSTLGISSLRYKLDNNVSNILSNQEEVLLYVNDNIKDSRKVITGTLNYNESITYNLRLWIDEASTVEQSANKIYKGKVVILSVPKQIITLNLNGGQIASNSIKREIGKQIGDIEEPSRIGYTFAGWYRNQELTQSVNNNTIVSNSMTNLYAKWNANTNTPYKVEHYQMDMSGNYSTTPYETDNLTGTSDSSVTPSVKTYTGFTSPSTQTVNINADGSQVVKYYYARNKYTIIYNANSGSVSPTSVTDYYGKSITLPTPTRIEYSFQGWYTATSGGSKFGNAGSSYTISGAKTMYAQWSKVDTKNFGYTGSVQTFTAPVAGKYKLEVWGAQGGGSIANGTAKTTGGYGGYATGVVSLSANGKLYVYTGNKGTNGTLSNCAAGGYNGGGRGTNDGYTSSTNCGTAHDDEASGGGGGATHIATSNRGILSKYSSYKSEVLIVAGGGGGGAWTNTGGAGGGYQGGKIGDRAASTQSSGYAFGKGQDGAGSGASDGVGGGGGGWYGGTASTQSLAASDSGANDPGSGGSGYIGNSSLLTSNGVTKHMTCYSCTTNSTASTRTQSTTNHSSTATSDYAKDGAGYAKITFLSN